MDSCRFDRAQRLCCPGGREPGTQIHLLASRDTVSLSQLLATHSMIQSPDPVSHSVSMHQGEIRGTTGAQGSALVVSVGWSMPTILVGLGP